MQANQPFLKQLPVGLPQSPISYHLTSLLAVMKSEEDIEPVLSLKDVLAIMYRTGALSQQDYETQGVMWTLSRISTAENASVTF